MGFIQPFLGSVNQCGSYVNGALTYTNYASATARAWAGITHPHSRCFEAGARTALVGLGVLSGVAAVTAVASAINPRNSRTYRVCCLVLGTLLGASTYASLAVGLAGRPSHVRL